MSSENLPAPVPGPIPGDPAWWPYPGQMIENNRQVYYIGPKISSAGAFSVVYRCYDEWHNALVAKVLKRHFGEVQADWERETQSLLLLRHPYITFPFDAFVYNGGCYLILEDCNQSLDLFISRPGIHGEFWLPYFASDILQALRFIHSAGVIHKDLHPGNVYVSATDNRLKRDDVQFKFKIGDLGISKLEQNVRLFDETMHPSYRPPEYYNPTEFGTICKATDMYHVGMLMLGMIRGGFQLYTRAEILDGLPRQQAEAIPSVYGPHIAIALRRHVDQRYESPLDFWRGIKEAYRSIQPPMPPMSSWDIGQ